VAAVRDAHGHVGRDAVRGDEAVQARHCLRETGDGRREAGSGETAAVIPSGGRRPQARNRDRPGRGASRPGRLRFLICPLTRAPAALRASARNDN
jgi:hypothetical protein